VEYRILGPLEVVRDRRVVPVRGKRQRAVLVALLLRANSPVSIGRLIDELWFDEPPPSAPKIVQNCVSQLRRDVVNGSLVTRPSGYELRVGAGELDLAEFERLVGEGRSRLSLGEPAEAAAMLRSGLALWRGPPLCDCAQEPFAAREIARLEDLHVTAVMDRVGADLALGHDVNVVPELEQLLAQHPLLERLRGQLMLALYRSGRQADALDVYRDGRRVLVEELGIEPGPALKRLEQAVLTQDPTLERPAATLGTSTRRSRALSQRAVLVLVAAAAAAALGSVLIALRSHDGRTAVAPPDSVALFNPRTARPIARLGVGSSPIAIAAGNKQVWVLNAGESSLTSIDPRSDHVESPAISVSTHAEGVTSLAFAADTPWATDSTTGNLIRISGFSGPLAQTKIGPAGYYLLAAGGGAIWVASNDPEEMVRVDPSTGLVTARFATPGSPVAAAVANDAIWVVSVDHAGRNLLTRFNLMTHRIIASIGLPAAGTDVAAGFGAIWVVVNGADLLVRVNPGSNAIARTIDVGDGPNRITTGFGAVWVTNARSLTLARVDPQSNRVTATTHLEALPRAVLAAFHTVWVVGA
jgi:DNA-binding SARP family transcriptional activator/DNA-binding beta-propeller fold protein YncE